jgi:hypothetical protein
MLDAGELTRYTATINASGPQRLKALPVVPVQNVGASLA